MQFRGVQCPKGHFYDSSQYSSCPVCAEEAKGGSNNFFDFSAMQSEDNSAANNVQVEDYGRTEPATNAMGDYGATEPATSAMEDYGATEPAGAMNKGVPGYGRTEPLTRGMGGYGPTEPVTGDMGMKGFDRNGSNYNAEEYGSTQPVFLNSYRPISGQNGQQSLNQPMQDDIHGFLPVVGWLVSIEGPTRGTDYRIRPNMNYIGSDNSNDIVIKGDNTISHRKAAVIGYDPEGRMFIFGPADGRNFVRVNKKPTLQQVELNPRDIIQVGSTKLLFVPLCDENFNWD